MSIQHAVAQPRKKVAIVPHPKLLLSLRSNTESNEEAVADLVDNALDQDVAATSIRIIKDPQYLIIADNGSGMTEQTLIDAMRLGSHGLDVPTANDLGLFGIGLKNAAGALGTRITVITKHKGDIAYTAVYDLIEIAKSGEFAIPIYPSSDQEQARLQHLTNSETGTALIIENTDKIKVSDSTLTKRLKTHLGEVYRIFIANHDVRYEGEINKDLITVNGERVEPIFPLKAEYVKNSTVEINDQIYDFTRPDGTPFSIRLRFGYFPQILTKEAGQHGFNMNNQGFYVMRNDRQLERAKWFDIVAKHPDFNRLRGEIYYTGDLDDVFTTNYEKNRLKLEQWFRDALKNKVGGVIASYKARNAQEYNTGKVEMNEQEVEDLNRIKSDIESKAGRLPKLKKKPSKPQLNEGERQNNKEQKQPKTKVESPISELLFDPTTKAPKKVELIQFDTGRLEASRICLFEDIGNGAIKIRFNVDHPFYKFFLSQPLIVKDAFGKLLFVMGRSIHNLSAKSEDMVITMDDFQLTFGDEYRKLLE